MARDQVDMTPINSRDELVAWFEQGCKPKSQFRIGTEHEKFAFTVSGHRPVPYGGPRGIRALLDGMQGMLGWEPIMVKANFSCSVPMRNLLFGLQPCSNHATNSSRELIGVMSTWSRAMQGSGEKGRDLTHAARQRAIIAARGSAQPLNELRPSSSRLTAGAAGSFLRVKLTSGAGQ